MEEVELRDVRVGDLPTLFEHQRQLDANRMAAFPARDFEGFMQHWEKILADKAVVAKSILVHGDLAGNIVSFEQGGQQQVGYWIGQQFWGKGIASNALGQLLDLVEVRPLYAHVAKHNAGSIRVLEKCGFELVGEDRVTDLPDGAEVDEFIFRLR